MSNSVKSCMMILVLLVLTGCSTISNMTKGQLENRLVMTINGDELSVNSKWGSWFGMTSVIAEKDRAALILLLRASQSREQ